MKTLHFKDQGAGFLLKSPGFKEEDWNTYNEDLTGEFGTTVLTDGQNAIVFYELIFFDHGYADIEVESREAKKIYKAIVFYDVPALGVTNATFPQVLEAVRQYYLKKAARKEAVPA